MNTIIRNMHLTVTENPVGCGYRYCVSEYAMNGYVAFRTAQGLREWLKDFGLSLCFTGSGKDHREENRGGWYKAYRVVGECGERLFWEIGQIPEGARRITDLSNGSMVDCYLSDIDGVMTIFRPNPNYKDIYKPILFAKHRELSLAR